MKKTFFLVALVASSLMAFAKSESKVVLTSGSLDFLKDAGQYAYYEVDWTNTNVVEFDRKLEVENDFGTIDQYNEKQGADWVKDWDRVRKATNLMLPLVKGYGMECWFPGKKLCFNNKNKNGLHFTANPEWYAIYNQIIDPEEKKEMEESVTLVDPTTAKYKVTIFADFVDMGNGAAAGFGGLYAGGAIMKGRIQVLNLQDNSIVAEMDINYVKGWGSFFQYARLQALIQEIFVTELLSKNK